LFAQIRIQEEFVLAKSFQYQLCDAAMLCNVLCENKDVVEIHANDTFHDEILEDVIHHCLEGGGRVS
jgi:hypothetical protein